MKPCQGIEKDLLQELLIQTHFAQRAGQCSINRDGVLKQIQRFVQFIQNNMQYEVDNN